MKTGKIGLIVLVTMTPFLLFISFIHSHSIHYEIQQKGMAMRVFYAKDDPAGYSQYELFGPGDPEPHQTGRTDKNGFLGFVPDRPGIWKIKVWGESTHGFHGVTMEVGVDQALQLESFSKPLVATSTKLIVGISIIFGVFGIYALIRSRERRAR